MAITSYNLEFHTVPVAALGLALASPPTDNASISAYLVGYLLWVLIEYWMHRYLFHRVWRKEHWIHHRKPASEAGSPPTLITHLLLGMACACLWAFLGRYIGAALGSGLLLGYLSYIVPHHYMHRGFFTNAGFSKRHRLHHRGVEANFNVLNPLGDLVFGTYQKP